MKEATKKTLKRVGTATLIAGVIAGTVQLVKKAWAEEEEERPEPPEPPPEGTGRVQGYVIDAITDQTISEAAIYVDGEPNATADTTGGFRTSYLDYGSHILTIYGDGYETGTFNIMLEQSLLEHAFYLEPLEEIPGFPDAIDVTSIRIQPPTARLGETIAIGVYLLIPYPTPIPETVTGTIIVDGQQLTKTAETRGIRNCGIWFEFTPPVAELYTVRAKDKSATFEVLGDTIGTFYCPFGCVAPTEAAAWESKWGLLGSWISLDQPTWYPDYPAGENCMVVPRFFGGGTGATGYEGTVYCPLCHEAMRTGRTPGDHSYMWALAEMLFDHIERAHPEVQWGTPPAWLQWIERGFDIFCIHGHCNYEIFIDGVKVWHYPSVSRRIAAPSLVVAPGEHIVKVEGLALGEGYPYRWLTVENSISIHNYGDRLTLNVETGGTTLVTWEDLLAG